MTTRSTRGQEKNLFHTRNKICHKGGCTKQSLLYLVSAFTVCNVESSMYICCLTFALTCLSVFCEQYMIDTCTYVLISVDLIQNCYC